MVTYYLDTSALLKLYVNEIGSQWLHHTLGADDVRVTAQIAIVEMGSAFNRRLREGTVQVDDYTRLAGRFRHDCLQFYHFMALNGPILNIAWDLLGRHPLRSYDTVHLATALFIQELLTQADEAPLIFLSSDLRLNTVALAEGLTVDNPNQHA